MAKASLRKGLIVVLVALGLAACGKATPLDYVPEADEMKPGSGLFSGEAGGFVIYGKPRVKEDKPRATPSP